MICLQVVKWGMHKPFFPPFGYDMILQIHWPVRMAKGSVGFEPENLVRSDIPSTWKAMEALYDSGKARAIGVSNFSIEKLGDLLSVARIPPAANQVECHPSWQQPKLREFCKSKGVHLSVSLQNLHFLEFVLSICHVLRFI